MNILIVAKGKEEVTKSFSPCCLI